MNKYLRIALQATGITVVMVFFVLFLTFLGLNLILGCETWDQSLWTKYNSCITPLQLLGLE